MNLLEGLPMVSDTLALWIASILAQITGVVMLATVTARTWARFHPALRHGIWLGSLLAVLASPFLAAASIQGDWSLVRVPVLAAERPSALPDASAAQEPSHEAVPSPESPVLPTGTWADIDLETTYVESTPVASSPVDPAPVDLEPSMPEAPFDAPRTLFALLVGVWLAGSIFLAVRLAHGAFVLAKIRRRVQTADGLAEALDLVRQRLPGVELPQIGLSDEIPGPVAAGLWCPIVLVPVELAGQLAPTALADVLMHECAHLIERHTWSGFLSRVAVTLFWPHPLVHYLASQLARAREEVCDNYVLCAGSPTGYARTLLALAPRLASPGPHPAAALGLLQPTWKLEDRVAGLLNPRRKTMIRVPRWQALTVVATLAVVALGVAATRFVNAEESPAEASALAFADDKKPQPLAEVAVADSLHLPLRIVDSFNYGNAGPEPLALPALTLSEEPQNQANVASSFARGAIKPTGPRAGKNTVAWLVSPPQNGGCEWRPVAVTREKNRITLHVEAWIDNAPRLKNLVHQTVHAVSLGVLPAEDYEFRIQVQTMFWDAVGKVRHYENTKLVQGSIKIKLDEDPAENLPLPSLGVKDLEAGDMLARPISRSWQNSRPIHAELFADVAPEPGVRVGTFDLAAWHKLPQKTLPELKPAVAGEHVYAVVVGPELNLYESMRLRSIEWIDQRAILKMEMWRDDGVRRKNYNFYPMTIVPIQSHAGEAFRAGDYQVDVEWTLMYSRDPGGMATASTRDQIVERGGVPNPVPGSFAKFVAGAGNTTKFSVPAKQAPAGRAALDDTKPDQAEPKIAARFVQTLKPIVWESRRAAKHPVPGVTVGSFDAAFDVADWETQPYPKYLPEVKPPVAGEPVYAVIAGPELNSLESMHVERIEWTDRRAVVKMQLRRDDGERDKNFVFVPVIAVPLEPQGKSQLVAGDYHVELEWTLLYSPVPQGAVTTYTREQIVKLGAEAKPAQKGFAEFAGRPFHKAAFSVPGAAKQAARPSARLTDIVAAAPEPKEGKFALAPITMLLEAQTKDWTPDSNFEFRCTVTNNTARSITFPHWGMLSMGDALEIVDGQGQALKFPGYRFRTAKETPEMFPTIEAGNSHVFKLSGRIQGTDLLRVEERQGGAWTATLVPGSSYKIRAVTATEGTAEYIKKQFVFARADNLWTGNVRSNELKVTLAKSEPAEAARLEAAPPKAGRLTELAAAAPDPKDPNVAPVGVSMQLEAPTQWTAGGMLRFRCTVTNTTTKAITFPGWGLMDVCDALEVVDAEGRTLKSEGGRDRTGPATAEMFPTIEAGKSHVFTLSGRVSNSNMLVVSELQGGVWQWNLKPDATYSIRATASTEGKAEELKKRFEFARVENLWTGKVRSAGLKVTLGKPAEESKQADVPAKRLTEIARAAAPEPAGAKIEQGVTMQFEGPNAWTAGLDFELQCTVKNNTQKPILFPIWSMLSLGHALEVLDAGGKVTLPEGGSNRAPVPGPKMFTSIEAGKSQVFKLSAQVDAENRLSLRQGGSVYWWKLAPGKFTVRAVASYDDKFWGIKAKFPQDQADLLWSGRIRSNDLNVTLNEVARAPGGNAPAIPLADVTMDLDARPTDWTTGGKIEFVCTVKNNGKQPIVFPAWGMMDISHALEVVAADGKVLPWGGGRDGTKKSSGDMFPTIEPGKSHVFKLSGSVDGKNLLIVHELQGGVWTTELKPGPYTLRAVAQTAGKAEDIKKRFSFAKVDTLWTGTIRSNDLKVTLTAGKTGEPKQAAFEPDAATRQSLVQKFNELKNAPEGNAPAIPAGDLSMELAIRPVDWTAGGKMEFQCTVNNNGKQAVVFPAWGMMDISRAVEIVNADGKALELKGMRDATRMASADMFPTIEAGKSHVFKLPGQIDASNVFAMHEVRGGSWSTKLAPGPYTIRAVMLTEGKAEAVKKAFKFAQVDYLWTGTLRSNEVKVQYAVGEAKVGANDPPKADGYGPESQGLRSRVALEKAKFAVGEKILVAYEIKNVSDKTQTVWHSGFWPNHMIVVIDANGKEPELTARGTEVRAAFNPKGPRDKNVPVEIAPGKEDKAWVKYDITELYVLTKPGKYAVQYVYEEGVKLQSNFAPFEITAAQ